MKTIKKLTKTFFACSMVLVVLGISLPIYAETREDAPNLGKSLEDSIRKLVDPFVSKLKAAPEPVVEPKAVVIEPVAPIVVAPLEPKPVAEVVPPATVKPLPPPPIVPPDVKVSGIVFNKTRPMAIMDGKVVEQGEKIAYPDGDVMVVKIDLESVYMTFKGKSFSSRIEQGAK